MEEMISCPLAIFLLYKYIEVRQFFFFTFLCESQNRHGNSCTCMYMLSLRNTHRRILPYFFERLKVSSYLAVWTCSRPRLGWNEQPRFRIWCGTFHLFVLIWIGTKTGPVWFFPSLHSPAPIPASSPGDRIRPRRERQRGNVKCRSGGVQPRRQRSSSPSHR